MPRLTHVAITIAATICVLAVAAPSRAAQNEALTLTGHWIGFGQSAPSPIPIPYPVVADISPLDQNRRFTIALELPAGQQGLTISGTVAASGNVNIEGGDAGIHFSAHGRFVEVGPGPSQLAALKYHVEAGPGPQSQDGFIILVHAQGGPNWRNPGPGGDVSGEWTGNYVSDRPGGGCLNAGGGMVMNLIQQRAADLADQGGTLTSAFGGTLQMDNVGLFDAMGTIGSPPDPNDGAAFVLIGLSAPPEPDFQNVGTIAVLIGLNQPGSNGSDAIRGSYALYGSFFDVFSAVWGGNMSALDAGGFVVERRAGPNGR
jgi:hypothetical protein